ncbi:ribonuclease H-like domain-containing protein [Daedaleopsis nitida]|nr:ribonuclease H-like domain-containing protein [Daedaleopsis nitida]
MQRAGQADFYAVAKGHVPGIYSTWNECQAQVKGFTGNKYKKFPSAEQARDTAKTEVIEDVVYWDGACKGNGQREAVAGVGVWNVAERCQGPQTNNGADLFAIVRVLKTTPHTKRPRFSKTGSKYSINCARKWTLQWLSNGWKTNRCMDVKNAPLIHYLVADLRTRNGQEVRFEHVIGHRGIEGNEGADRLAKHAATLHDEKPEWDWDALGKRLAIVDEMSSKAVPTAGTSAVKLKTVSRRLDAHSDANLFRRVFADFSIEEI